MSFTSVTILNNNAIALFQRGYHEDAVASIRLAINQLVGSVSNEPDVVPTNTTHFVTSSPMECDDKQSLDESMHQSSYAMQIEQTRYTEALFPVPVEKSTTSGRETHNATSMYSCAMILAQTCQDCTSEYYITQASVAVLYNLAFMHHWRAIHLGISSGLPKALQLYSMALRIIPPKGNLPDIENLVLAIWNNMGHIHSQQFQIDEARACFDRLRFLLSHRAHLLYWLPKRDYEIFLLSAMFQGSDLHLAPAA
jgi:tetratricopeptide (TPR) repeat protein